MKWLNLLMRQMQADWSDHHFLWRRFLDGGNWRMVNYLMFTRQPAARSMLL